MPWREAGLSERQAAAHLVGRLAFGARPGELERVLAQGLEGWLESQLTAPPTAPELASRLQGISALELPVLELPRRFPSVTTLVRDAIEAGVLPADFTPESLGTETAREAFGPRLVAFAQQRGIRPQRELFEQLKAQKLLRAVYAENQLTEVLTDFWLNHFNVPVTHTVARTYLLAFERDAIRPHVLGRFRDLLGATARHPAMLYYLDNAQSAAPESAVAMVEERPSRARRGVRRERRAATAMSTATENPYRPQGINENYARELLELHTLSVDGGYVQRDVTEVARAFTGWTAHPPGADAEAVRRRVKLAKRADAGRIFEEGFLFRPDFHDGGPKIVLGHSLPAGRGIEDGQEVLDLLAAHPATARHLARKLAVRFVSDDPPAALVERLAARFVERQGDLEAVMRTLVESPEFWSREAIGAKIKSPFELAVSALRGLGAEVSRTSETIQWIARMGQPLYGYQAPTGYPDEAGFWVNAGSLLGRMNFGLSLAAGRVRGVRFDLARLAGYREPESRPAALDTYLALLLPERDVSPTRERLVVLVQAPALEERLDAAVPVAAARTPEALAEESAAAQLWDAMLGQPLDLGSEGGSDSVAPTTPLEQVVGVIIGSPEFQRR